LRSDLVSARQACRSWVFNWIALPSTVFASLCSRADFMSLIVKALTKDRNVFISPRSDGAVHPFAVKIPWGIPNEYAASPRRPVKAKPPLAC